MKDDKRFELSDYDLICVLRFVLRHCWMVVLSALIFIMAVYLAQNLAFRPTYTSSVTFAVTSRNVGSTAITNIAATDTVAGQFGGLLESDIVRNAAAEKMGLSSFPAEVSITVPQNTNILQMEITSSTPELAYKSALAIIDVHTLYSDTVFRTAIIDSINGPTIPEQPSNAASRSSLLRLSGPLGAACMCVLLVMMSIRADTVQTVSGAKRQVDGNLLATIYHERNRLPWRDRMKHKKKAILITDPTCSFYYTETIHQIRVQVERARETKQQQVFVIASCSENEGKSTVAANLSLSLAQKHRKVLLIDADMRKPAQQLIFETEVQRGKDFSALLSRGVSPATLKDVIRYDSASNLHTLYTAPVHRKQVEALSRETLASVLDALREEFSFIIIDTPPIGFFADAEVIADVADASILVIRQDVAPSIVINDAIDNLSEAESSFLGYVFNNVRSFRAFSFRSGTYEYGYGYGYSYGYGYGKSDGKQAANSSGRSRKGGRSHG